VEYYQRQREPCSIMLHAVQDAEIKKKVPKSVSSSEQQKACVGHGGAAAYPSLSCGCSLLLSALAHVELFSLHVPLFLLPSHCRFNSLFFNYPSRLTNEEWR